MKEDEIRGMDCTAFRRGTLGGLLLALLWGSGLQAQEIGDRVRVRMEEQQDWIDSSLSGFDPEGTFLLRGSIYEDEEEYRVADIQRGDWYDRRPLAQDLVIVGLALVAVEAVLPCDRDFPQSHSCYSLNRGSQFAIQAVIGMGLGALRHLLSPGSWKDWIEDGLLIR